MGWIYGRTDGWMDGRMYESTDGGTYNAWMVIAYVNRTMCTRTNGEAGAISYNVPRGSEYLECKYMETREGPMNRYDAYGACVNMDRGSWS